MTNRAGSRQTSGPAGEWRRYLSEIAEFRLTLEQNLSDLAFESVGGRVVYLFDASVVQVFLNPTGEVRHFAILGQHLDQSELAASAIAAAEFLFSRRLPGQNDSPAYLTPGHAEDVNNIVGRIGDRISMQRTAIRARVGSHQAGVQQDLRSLLAARQGGKLKERDVVKRLGSLLPQLASSLFDEHVHEAKRFQRLLDEDLIRPLRLLPAATREVLDPDHRLVSAWARSLRDERRSHHRSTVTRSASARIDGPSPAERRERRDAESLAQLVFLNEAAAEQSEKVRYVMVTTDRSMWRVYSRWFFAGERGMEFAAGFALRRPTQYLPILNTDQTGQERGHSEMVSQIRDIVDSLFDVLRDDSVDYMRALASMADPGFLDDEEARANKEIRLLEGMLSGDRVSRSVSDVRARWSAATQGAMLLNAHLLQRHMDRDWAALSNVLGEEHWRQGVLAHLDDVLEGLEDTHAAFVSDGFLGLRSPIGANKLHVDATPLLFKPVRERKHAYPMSAVDADVIAEFTSGGAESLTSGGRGDSSRPRPLQHAALISFRLRRYATAMRFCERAVAQLRLHARRGTSDVGRDFESECHELFYLEAVISRHLGRGERTSRALGQLAGSLDYYAFRKDYFSLIRTRCEQVALRLLSVLTAIRSPRGDAPDQPIYALREFLRAADTVVRAMRDARWIRHDGRVAALIDALNLQAMRVLLLDRLIFRTESLDQEVTNDILSFAEEATRYGKATDVGQDGAEVLAVAVFLGPKVEDQVLTARLAELLGNRDRIASDPTGSLMADIIVARLHDENPKPSRH